MDKAIICDIDGTLANHEHRLHFVDAHKNKKFNFIGRTWWDIEANKKFKPDYDSFYDAMDKDTVNEWCSTLIYCMYLELRCQTLLVTGRPYKYQHQTENLIYEALADIERTKYIKLFMRLDEDFRPSPILKKEIYDREIKGKYDVLFVIEDSSGCAKMYRSLGLTVLNCKGD
jgi:FMN phosphatase YigB (HAD superfamily)